MKEIKFRYRIRYVDGTIGYHYFTLQDIEKHSGLKKVNLEKAGIKILSRDLYIGFKDKNKKDIYERDIVRTNEAGWIAKVIWNDAGFMCVDNKGGFSADCWWEKFKVIGNMDQNPELLGGKNGRNKV